MLHQWEAEKNKWIKIGTVVDAVGSSRKQLYEGKEYDYVFDVDIQDGAPALKLPYNASGIVLFRAMYSADQKNRKENPYQAAHQFLTRNELPLSYLDQVANFIEQNAAAVQLGGPNNQYVDPYTGALPPSFLSLVMLKKDSQVLQGMSNQMSVHKRALVNTSIRILARIDISLHRTPGPAMSALVM